MPPLQEFVTLKGAHASWKGDTEMDPSVILDHRNSSTATTRRHLTRWVSGSALSALFLGIAASGQARKKGGKKKKYCKCAPGFHCEKGTCVPDV